jgi:bacteriorhodopsin
MADNSELLTQIRDLMATMATQPEVEAVVVPGPMQPPNKFGQACLWVGTACMAISSCYFLKHAQSSKNNAIEMLTFFITAIATVAYLTMATFHGAEDNHTRQPFYYARYIDWLFTTPLMIWDLMALTGADAMDIFTAVGMDVLMIVCGIAGCLLEKFAVRWAMFVLGCLFFLGVCKELMKGMGKGTGASRGLYASATYLTIISWTCYPIVWALCEGADVVSINVSILLYTVMDVTAKCVFGYIIVSNREALESVYMAQNASIKAEEEL